MRDLAERHRSDISPHLDGLLAATTDLLHVVTAPLPELDSAWSTRPAQQRLPHWERLHFPLETRARITEAERTVGFTRVTLVNVCTGELGQW
ncbi:hypothetical protein NQK81_02415 [Amycolatopsis roodepoortensis]|uniref:hypothetical protein n=1 Tax=Amycolatopsis roodepoortensis TaxID=700274 RepID=UPI00214AA9B9|nr:hypothetical protein [Amycolatopsis roodepoortensis]UUV32328.1 hypothetical protein NQK81_02415 [Amycolatopsis roodepoortensis]